MMQRVGEKWEPPPNIPTIEWLKKNYRLPEEGADLPGPYNPDYVPYLWGIFAAFDMPWVKTVVMMKAAQVGWTFGLIGFLGKRIHTRPSPMIILFPKDGAAREFADEKLKPAIQATPVLAECIDTSTSRKDGNRALFKKFIGGFLKMIGSNSISNVKSTPAPLAVVEEPDDTNDNIKEQGDSIRLIKERLKRFRDSLLILGGTPSVEGLSRVEEQVKLSDQRVLPIQCHECGDKHVLDFENVTWMSSDDGLPHEVYGMAIPDSAVYACPHCGAVWDDWRRKQNILSTVQEAKTSGDVFCGWVATAESSGGVVGFKELNELYVCLPGTSLADLVRDYLEAEYDAEVNGDQSGRIVFTNSKLGRPYRFKDDQADADALREAAVDYPELQVQQGGLIITCGIDVQHDRLAIIMRAWGRNDQSSLLYWGELYAEGTCADKKDKVWEYAEKFIFGAIPHASGKSMYVSSLSIDSSDGQTSDAVYSWVRKMSVKHRAVLVMAIKGSSSQQDPEIFSTPRAKSVDHKNPKKQTKADRHGVKVYMVGTNKAKDWLAVQFKLEATGRGRFHFYQGVRADYFDQVTGEVKAPHRTLRNKKVWQQKSGVRIEAWDCEVYALHAARARRVHLMSPSQWDALEQELMQGDLFTAGDKSQVSSDQASSKPISPADIARKLNG